MALPYNELVVLTLFRSENPGVNQPTNARLENFARDLENRLEATLIEHMTQSEIALSRENKSRVLMFAMFSNGSDTVKVRNGCRYFNHVMSLDLT